MAISRYGARIIPNTEETIAALRSRGQLVHTRLPIFGDGHAPAPGAERAADAIQLPVYSSLEDADVARMAAVVRDAVGAA